MNDLLPKAFIPGRGSTYVDLKLDTMRDLEMGDMASTYEQQKLASFFEEVGVIKKEMEKVKELLSKLQAANEESKSIHQSLAMKALREHMDRLVEEVLRNAKSIKTKLELLDNANMENRKYAGCEKGTPIDRTRTSITHSLRKKLKDLMQDFQILREKIMAEYRETVERRYYTITGQKPDEDAIESIIHTGESENFLQKAIHEQGRGRILDAIKEIHERHDAVKEIEKNLLELHQIFLDMAVIVEAQGERLNDIEHYVNNAASCVENGNQQMRCAKQYQRDNRKWMCIGIVLLLILILIIVVPIAASLKKS